MATRLRISPFLRRAAVTAALGALFVPTAAGAATAEAAAKKKVKLPVITGVKPMNVAVGETLEIRGRNFVRGRNRNSVVFKRDGGKAVFIKASVGTTKLLKVTIPAKLQQQFATSGGVPKPTRFRLRVLAKKFGKSFTRVGLSPTVSAPRPPVPPGFVESQPGGDCDGDGAKNGIDADDDNDGLSDLTEKRLNLNPCVADTDGDGLLDRFEFDCDRDGVLNESEIDSDKDLLSDALENSLGTDFCSNDSDGDGIEDGYEYRSARDLNDDEYQDPNDFLPYPGKRPYPNPLDGTDAGTDHDGDSLTLAEEQRLWIFTYLRAGNVRSLDNLYYSAGMQYSIYARDGDNRRQPALAVIGYERQADFENWLANNGYATVFLPDDNVRRPILDVNRNGSVSQTTQTGYLHSERYYMDIDANGWLSDDERDEDADGLSNHDESHGVLRADYWASRYSREHPFHLTYAGTEFDDSDSDGDGVRDGADDQDHDDIPNIMELSRNMATGRAFDDPQTAKTAGIPTPAHGRVNPYNPCLPDTGSRTCPRYVPFAGAWAPFDGPPYDPEGDDPDYLVRN